VKPLFSFPTNICPKNLQLLHESIYQTVLEQLSEVYKQVRIGDPLEKGTLLGPLHTPVSRENFVKGIRAIKSQVIFSYTFYQ
jgi:acyl-CoA reductase-like NAD-dependent aldehyde dehydrogenase